MSKYDCWSYIWIGTNVYSYIWSTCTLSRQFAIYVSNNMIKISFCLFDIDIHVMSTTVMIMKCNETVPILLSHMDNFGAELFGEKMISHWCHFSSQKSCILFKWIIKEGVKYHIHLWSKWWLSDINYLRWFALHIFTDKKRFYFYVLWNGAVTELKIINSKLVRYVWRNRDVHQYIHLYMQKRHVTTILINNIFQTF